MATNITYKIIPKDGSLPTANQLVKEIIKTAPTNISTLNIEVLDVYCDKPKVGNLNSHCNVTNQSVIIH